MSAADFPTDGPAAAAHYLREGFQPIPTSGRSKTIYRDRWERERVAPGDDLSRFAGVNTGLLLGGPSGGLVDVDLDTPEAVAVAPYLLPPTKRVSGRKSNPRSHWWYRRAGGEDGTEPFAEPPAAGKGGKVLVELRANGMTLVPPSINPGDADNGHTPEPVVWHDLGEPAAVRADGLRQAVARVAGAALLARRWPEEGRHLAALHLSGALLRAPGWDVDRVKTLLTAVCAAASDGELANRLQAVEATAENLADPDAKVSGWPSVGKLFGPEVTAKLKDWLAPQPRVVIGKNKPGAGGRGGPTVLAGRHVPLPPYKPFPADAMPGPWADFCREGGRVLKCDPGLLAVPNLAVLAGAVGMTRRVFLGGTWTEPAVVWACGVGESGDRKSPAVDLSADFALARQEDLLAEYATAMDAYKQEVADLKRQRRAAGKGGAADVPDDPDPPLLKRVVISDATIERVAQLLHQNPRGLLLHRDELAGWVGSFTRYKGKAGGSDEPNWLQLFRAANLVHDRVTGPQNTIIVPHAAVSVVGTIQPGRLKRLLGRQQLDSGLAARVLFCMPPRTPKRYVRDGLPSALRAAAERSLAGLYALAPREEEGRPAKPEVVRLGAAAERKFERFVNAWGERQFATDGDLAAALSKLEGYAARIALLHHLVTAGGDPGERVGRESVDAGIAVVEWAAYETARVYRMLQEPDEGAELRALADRASRLALKSASGDRLTPRDLQRSRGDLYPSSEVAEAALEALAGAGVGRWDDAPAYGGPGRPAGRAFVIHPTPDNTDETPGGDDWSLGDDPDEAPDTTTSGQNSTTEAVNGSAAATDAATADTDVTPDTDPEDLSVLSGVGFEFGANLKPAQEPVPDAIISTDPVEGSVGYTLVADPAELGAVEAAVRAAAAVGLDTETTGLDPRADRLRLLSLHTPAGVYLIDCFAVDPAPLFNALAATEIVGHNLLFDLAFLYRLGFTPGRVFDTMLASQVLDAGDKSVRHTLKDVAARHLGDVIDKAEQKSDWSSLLTPDQLRYAALDAAVLVRLRAGQLPKIAEAGLTDTLALEHRALPAVHWLGVSGVGLDRAGWEALAGGAEAERDRLAAELDALSPAGHDLTGPVGRNWNSPEQVKQALAGVGVTVDSADDDALAGVAHPLAGLVRDHRSAAKRAGTYGRAWLDHVADDDRVYPGWRQLGAGASGRMSCAKPNLQQLPRDARYRRLFVAPPGRVLVKADYSQIELRLAAKIAGEPAMLAAYRRGDDLHANTARAILGVGEVSKADRQLAKAVNFGLLYGMGAQAFAQYARSNYGVKLTDSEAAAYRRKFFQAYPGLAAWHRTAGGTARDTRTVGGRRRLAVGRFTERLNTPVQGTGADGLKAALALLWERRHDCPGAVPVLVVHDEIVVEADADRTVEAKAWLVRAMTDGMAPLAEPVPVEVEATVAQTWGGDQ